MKDEELLHEAQKGHVASFHELMERHAPGVFRLAFRLVGNESDAEDVVQETFMGAFRQMSGFRGEATVKTWLSRIAVRQAARHYRIRGRGRMRPLQVIETEGSERSETIGDGPSSESIERSMDVRRAVEKLTPEHREVILLREFDGMSYGEIADVLSVPQGTVESRLHRARQELKELLRDYLS